MYRYWLNAKQSGCVCETKIDRVVYAIVALLDVDVCICVYVCACVYMYTKKSMYKCVYVYAYIHMCKY